MAKQVVVSEDTRRKLKAKAALDGTTIGQVVKALVSTEKKNRRKKR